MSAHESQGAHNVPDRAPLDRGLYTDRATGPHGETAITLVDRHGEALARVQVMDRRHVPTVKRALASLLSELDPPPDIRLV